MTQTTPPILLPLTAEAALDMLTQMFPYATGETAKGMSADALALSRLASSPKAGTFFTLAAEAAPANTLAFRRFMIEHARQQGLSAGAWRVYADRLPARLVAFKSPPFLPEDLGRPLSDFGPYAYLDAKKVLRALPSHQKQAKYPAGSMGAYVAEMEATDAALDFYEAQESARIGF